MKILIVGSGGREYAIGKKIKFQNPDSQLFFAPGNGGTSRFGENIPANDNEELLEFALKHSIDLTIIGPEKPLVDGIVDLFQENQLPIFGANKKAAELEGSKTFAKDFMKKYNVRTAAYQNFKHFIDAQEYLKKCEFPVVIKAAGLAAGKGVVICQDEIEAEQTIRSIMLDKKYGEAGNEIVIEKFLEGFEVSILSIFNGKEISCMLSAQDHKKAGEGDSGPNTGGMGVVVPNPQYTQDNDKDFKTNILEPTLKGLLGENLLFHGVIFFGLMVTEKGCYLLEYNVRFGDPEIQTLLPLLQTNFLENIQNAISENKVTFQWETSHSVCVVMCSGGYPHEYETGYEIQGLENLKDSDYDIAGAQLLDNKLLTSGGRVLDILGKGENLEQARRQAYENVKKVRFDYNYYRNDI